MAAPSPVMTQLQQLADVRLNSPVKNLAFVSVP
jgi:hypothetical protein